MFVGKEKFKIFIFRERGREGEREGEKHRCERNIGQLPLLCAPTRDRTATQASALDGN